MQGILSLISGNKCSQISVCGLPFSHLQTPIKTQTIVNCLEAWVTVSGSWLCPNYCKVISSTEKYLHLSNLVKEKGAHTYNRNGTWISGFPDGTSSEKPACWCRRLRTHRFHPCISKIPRRRAWQPARVFLPGESHGQRSLVGYSPWGHKELDMSEWLSMDGKFHDKGIWDSLGTCKEVLKLP